MKDNKRFGFVCNPKYCLVCMIDFLSKNKKQTNDSIMEIFCCECGHKMTLVRPGKYQCDNSKCKSNKI